jgi:hypothetical protein
MAGVTKAAKELRDLVFAKGLDALGPNPVDDAIKQERAVQRLIDSSSSPRRGELPILRHTSPNKFGEFDHSYMGAGEGRQVYGHGTYLSEGKGAQSFYQDQAKRMKAIELLKKQGRYYANDTRGGEYPERILTPAVYARAVLTGNSTVDDAYKGLLSGFLTRSDVSKEVFESALQDFPKLGIDPYIYKYLVDYDVPPSSLVSLDEHWGANPKVRDVIDILNSKPIPQSVMDKKRAFYEDLGLGDDFVAERVGYLKESKIPFREFYPAVDEMREIEKLVTPKGLSDAMLEAGVPGYRFYDGASRGSLKNGKRTENFVAFSDKDPRILASQKGATDLKTLLALVGGGGVATAAIAPNTGGTSLEEIAQRYGGPVEQRIEPPVNPTAAKIAETIEDIPLINFMFGGLQNWFERGGYGENRLRDHVGAAADLL